MKHEKKISEILFLGFLYFVIIFSLFICLHSFVFVISNSISDPIHVISTSVTFLPKGFSLDSYKLVIENSHVWIAYRNTLIYTILGTIINLIATLLFAYPLPRKDFNGRKFVMMFIIITMLFSGGLIPLFIISSLYLYNTYWTVLLPMAISTWNVIIARTFLQSLPISLQESAMIDGCNSYSILFRMVFTPDPNLQPLHVYLMKIVIIKGVMIGALKG